MTAKAISKGLHYVVTSKALMRSTKFTPQGQPSIVRHSNPAVRRGSASDKEPLVASFVMGLTTNDRYGPVRKLRVTTVRNAIMKLFQAGTIVEQIGWYESAHEASIRVTIENTGDESEFRANVEKALKKLTMDFNQHEIWYDFFRGTTRDGEPMSYVHD